jgi:hypothetical protein
LAVQSRFRFSPQYLALFILLCLPVLCVIGVTGYFRLGSETKALRQAMMGATPNQWEKQVAVNVGSLTLGLIRAGTRFLDLPPEARAALSALRGANVGVYQLQSDRFSGDRLAILAQADRAMKARGWERVVGVVEREELVAIYLPRKGGSTGSIRCCLGVLDDRHLVIVSARGNLDPLIDVLGGRLDLPERLHLSALARSDPR